AKLRNRCDASMKIVSDAHVWPASLPDERGTAACIVRQHPPLAPGRLDGNDAPERVVLEVRPVIYIRARTIDAAHAMVRVVRDLRLARDRAMPDAIGTEAEVAHALQPATHRIDKLDDGACARLHTRALDSRHASRRTLIRISHQPLPPTTEITVDLLQSPLIVVLEVQRRRVPRGHREQLKPIAIGVAHIAPPACATAGSANFANIGDAVLPTDHVACRAAERIRYVRIAFLEVQSHLACVVWMRGVHGSAVLVVCPAREPFELLVLAIGGRAQA